MATENYERDGRPFYLEEVHIREPSSDIRFEKVIVEHNLNNNDETNSNAPTEQLNDTIDGLRATGNIKYNQNDNTSDAESIDSNTSQFNENACVIEDFVRNFLLRSNMFRTLEAFQSEWFQNKIQDNNSSIAITSSEIGGMVPDVYAKNELLNDKVINLTKDNEKLKYELDNLKEDYNKLLKERDFHRRHHRRIIQEKDKLLNDIKRQSTHYKNYEPTLKDLRRKYESAMKEKMLSNLERDRAVTHLKNSTQNNSNSAGGKSSAGPNTQEILGTGFRDDRESGKVGPTQHNLAVARDEERQEQVLANRLAESKIYEDHPHPKDAEWPADRRVNPKLAIYNELPKFNYQSLKVDVKVDISELPISSISLHPNQEIVVTGSDDKQWYLWSVPHQKPKSEFDDDDIHSSAGRGRNASPRVVSAKTQNRKDSMQPQLQPAQLQMSGTGHSDWISSVDFHPNGSILATGSGDATVRIWDLENNQAEIISFNDHQNAIWGVNFHSSGNFLASCSMDTTAKIWDLYSQRCRSTLRGHNDSINTCEFLEYSNTLLTGSADKTLKLWDARSHLCAHTYLGHAHSINSASFSKRGDKIVSADSFGIVNVFDVRNTSKQVKRIDLGIHAGNSIKFHPKGGYIIAACADGGIKIIENIEAEEPVVSSLDTSEGHTDGVNDVALGHDGNSLFSVGSDGTLRIWRN